MLLALAHYAVVIAFVSTVNLKPCILTAVGI
jgi:hypothetical protein